MMLAVASACTRPPARPAEEARADSAAGARTNPVGGPSSSSNSDGGSAAGEQLWSYSLTNGWLKSLDPSNHASDDVGETTAECRGRAIVRRCPGGRACWSWTLQDVQCTGRGKPRDADWLHESSDSSFACRGDTAWETKADELPGRGVCIPKGTFNENGELIRLRLECDWQCRVPGYGCSGGAHYEFTRDTSSTDTGTNRGR